MSNFKINIEPKTLETAKSPAKEILENTTKNGNDTQYVFEYGKFIWNT